MQRLVTGLSQLVRRAPIAVVIAAVLLTGIFAVLSQQVQTVSGNEGFAPDYPELDASETLAERFGDTSESVVQILLRQPGGDVISADGLEAVDRVRAAIQGSEVADLIAEDQPQRAGIVSYLDPVTGAAAAGIDVSTLNDEEISGLFTQAQEIAPEEQAGLIDSLLPDGAALGIGHADAGLMLVFLNTSEITGSGEDQFDQLIEIESALSAAVRDADLPAGIEAEPFSFALLFADQDEFTQEVARLFGAAFVIILVILAFVYWLRPCDGLTWFGASRRTAADVVLTLLTIVMAITWMNGMAVLLGPDYLGLIGGLTEITQVIPVLLIGLGVDYAIHLVTRYREEAGGGDGVDSGIERATRTVGVALVLATVTTAVGFLTNIVNPVPALRDFGILAAVGIMSAFVLMLSFVPSVRLLLDRRAEAGGRLPTMSLQSTGQRLLPVLMARTAVLAERSPIPTLIVTVLIGGSLGAFGFTQLDTRFSSTDFVPQDSPIVQTFNTIQDRFGGGFGETTEVLISGGVATPEVHNAMVETAEDLAQVDNVQTVGEQARADSPVAVLAQLVTPAAAPDAATPDAPLEGAQPAGGEATPEGNPQWYDPAFAEEAAGLGLQPDLTVAEDSDVQALYAAMLDAAPEAASRVLATGSGGEVELARFGVQTNAGEGEADELREDLNEVFAPVEVAGAEALATSNPIINDLIITALQESQVSSLFITLVAAMVLLVITFWIASRRPFLGVLTIAPVALVVLWTFGMMAATGIPLGPVTATIAALAVGIGVPYTIHITHRYQEDRLRYEDPAEAIRSTVRHTGGALAGSAFTTVAGFLVLVTSSLVPFRQFGLVTAYAIGFALLAATVVLPSMLALWDRYHRRKGHTPVEQEPNQTPAPVP